MSGFLLYEQSEGVAVVTMNRPDERNALTEEHQMLEFVELCARVRRDRSVKALVLTGAGSAFSAGGNLKNMRDKKGFSAGSPADIRDAYRNGIQQIPLALYELDVPTIAAVNGPAIGAGMDLTCMCDIRIASEEAKFAESFVKLGIIPGDGGAWLLPRIVGLSRASELAFTGDVIDAQQALAWNLVSRVVPPTELMDTALSLAARITEHPSHGLRMTKRLMREAIHCRLDTILEMSAVMQAVCHKTDDHREAVDAFLEKRTPKYLG